MRITVVSRHTICWVALAAVLSPTATTPRANGQGPELRAIDRLTALDPRWTVTFASAPTVSPGFDDQTAYVPLTTGELVAVDLDVGTVRWSMPRASTFPPTTGDGLVFTVDDRVVTALDQRTGALVWSRSLNERISRSVAWDGNLVVVATSAGEVVALASEGGEILWEHRAGSTVTAAPSFAGDWLFLALADDRIAAVERATGVLSWTLPLKGTVTGIRALDDQLLVGTRANLLHSVELARPRLRWTQKAGADVIGAATADERFIYFVAMDNVLRALDRRSGNVRWTRNLAARPSAEPTRVADVVLVPLSTGQVAAFRDSSGAPAFNMTVSGELSGPPFRREATRPTGPWVAALSREGVLHGFAPQIELPPQPITALPGVRAGG